MPQTVFFINRDLDLDLQLDPEKFCLLDFGHERIRELFIT